MPSLATAAGDRRRTTSDGRHAGAAANDGGSADPETAVLRKLRHANRLAQVVDVRASPEAPPPRGHSSDYQVVLTYEGLFGYRVGSRTDYFDVNRTLFVIKDEEFADSHPVRGVGHASLVVIPGAELRDELYGSASPASHPAFQSSSAPSSARLRLMTHFLRNLRPTPDTLRADEAIVAALAEALPDQPDPAGRRASPLVDRAKQLLHARPHRPISLEQFAREVGASPAHLTREFTRLEGLPLYRYQLNLRLNQALLQLPRCDSITELALDLGFSSHAHLTAAFTASFCISPSRYRADTRARVHAVGQLRRTAA